MNRYQRDVQSTLREAQRDMGSPVIEWDATQAYAEPETAPIKLIPCVPKFERRSTLIEVGGNPVVIDFAAIVVADQFVTWDSTEITWDNANITLDDMTPVPKSGQVVRFRGRLYKVLAVAWAPGRTHVRFEFVDPDSGR